MQAAPYTTEEDVRKRLGLIVLQADETIEDEFRHLACFSRGSQIAAHFPR